MKLEINYPSFKLIEALQESGAAVVIVNRC